MSPARHEYRALARKGQGSAALSVLLLTALSMAAAVPARADELADLKQQVQELERRIDTIMQQQAATQAAAQAAAQAALPPPVVAAVKPASNAPTFNAGPVTVTLGGFVDLMVIARSRNEAADWASNWNTAIPYPQSENYYLSEFHLTPRQSRFSVLAQGPSDPEVAAEAYLEGDFGGGPRTGNNNESTSFSPRIRHFFARYERKDSGWYLLFGQAWSMLTQNRSGIVARQELIPLTLDGQYAPGFTWLRVPQIRFVKNFGTTAAFGLSLENPAALIAPNSRCGTVPAPVTTAVCSTPGGAGYDANNNLSFDSRPDLIAKLAFDPGWGHYEILALERSFRDRINGGNNSTSATSGGGSVILPLVANRLEFSASGLAGKGVGRYGSAQLPDVTLQPSGQLAAIKGYEFLFGLTFKATPDLTLFAYGGREHADQTDFTTGVGAGTTYWGYGNPGYDNSNCLIEGSSGGCTAHTASITQGTIGGWWKFYQGTLGNMQLGMQLTNVKRVIYGGLGGAPSTDIDVGEFSFRYYPYQK